MGHAFPFAAVAAAALAACQQQTTTTVTPEESRAPETSTPVMDTTAAATASPTASASPFASLEPEVMALADWRGAKLDGELGCGFRREGADGSLLLAASDVDPAMMSEAAIKLGGKVYKLTTTTKGGFSALGKGARFVGPDGLFANVVRGEKRIRETPQIAEESPLYPAQLVISQGGREIAIDGLWECGP